MNILRRFFKRLQEGVGIEKTEVALALFQCEKKTKEHLGCPQAYGEDVNSSPQKPTYTLPSPQKPTYTLFPGNILCFLRFSYYLYSTCKLWIYSSSPKRLFCISHWTPIFPWTSLLGCFMKLNMSKLNSSSPHCGRQTLRWTLIPATMPTPLCHPFPLLVGGTCELLLTSRKWQRWWDGPPGKWCYRRFALASCLTLQTLLAGVAKLAVI